MATDATNQLIQRILNQLPPDAQPSGESGPDFLSQVNSVVANAASYAQLLSTAAGPIAAAAVASETGAIAAWSSAASALTTAAAASAQATATAAANLANATDQAAAAAAATSLAGDAAGVAAQQQALIAGGAAAATATAGAATAGIGAAVVLVVAGLVAVWSALTSSSGSTETEQLNKLTSDIEDIEDVVLSNWWMSKLGLIMAPWSPLETDLDNLANEGTGGFYVKANVSHFHGDALAYVNTFIPSKTPGADIYWERPAVQSQLLSFQRVAYAEFHLGWRDGKVGGWYGALPLPQAGSSLGGQKMASDPRTMLPFFLLGLESYLTLESLISFIDPSQPTFSQFLSQYQRDLQTYAGFLYSQYQLAVNGIAKSDLPATNDILSYLWFVAEVVKGSSFADNTQLWGGSEPLLPGYYDLIGPPYTGVMWNGVYGAVDSYPQYGVYQPGPPVPVPYSSPSYIIDVIDTDNFISQVSYNFQYDYLQESTLGDWILPWVQNKLILGRMARWKAIYLLNGYDKAWSILQHLQVLSGLPQLPTLTLDQDGMIANGDWSTREICSVLNLSGYMAPDVPGGTFATNGVIGSCSLWALVQCLNAIANGNWAGPPSTGQDSFSGPGAGPAASRPIGFRDRLAAAAV
jgi:hypothetical protein